MLEVVGLSRIHITLVDLSGDYGRLDGGVGVALAWPRVRVSLGTCQRPPEWVPFPLPGYCVLEDYEEHVGLGHTTQFRLALAKLSAEYNFQRLSAVELARLVGRGGTSGVGVHAFEGGGFVVDGGHSKKVKPEPKPSDFSTAPPPPLIARFDFPWKVYILNPQGGRRVFGEEELKAFRDFKQTDAGEVTRVVFMKLVPAVAERDLGEVLEAIGLIQNMGFKRLEWSLQSEKVREVAKRALAKGFVLGLSSFGPTLYTFVGSRSEGEELISEFGGNVVEPNNTGARVIWKGD